jgi:hypothetical protein
LSGDELDRLRRDLRQRVAEQQARSERSQFSRAELLRVGRSVAQAVARGANAVGRAARSLLSQRPGRVKESARVPLSAGPGLVLVDRDAQVEELDRKQLELREQRLGGDHPDLALLVQVVAERSRARGDRPAARFLYERALGITERTLGPDHPEVAEISTALAELSLETGDPEAAARWRSRADAISGRNTGPAPE